MTVAIGVAVSEGIVIAGDSRSTYGNPKGWPKVATDYTQKVYKIATRVGAATFGWGMLSGKNINSCVESFKRTIKSDENITEVLPKFVDYFEDLYNKHIADGYDQPVANGVIAFGFLIGGYDETGEGKLFRCYFPGKQILPCCSTVTPGASWEGQTDIIIRLIKGYDTRIYNTISIPQNIGEEFQKLEYIIYFVRMNLQDAIDFAIFLVRTTIEMQRFSDGIILNPGDLQGVGGSIDVALITDEGLSWIQKKELHGEVPSWIKSVT